MTGRWNIQTFKQITLWFFSNATVWNDAAQRVYIIEGCTILHLIDLGKLFMVKHFHLLICFMIPSCANINFYHDISDAKNSTPWFPISQSARNVDHPTISFFYAKSALPCIHPQIFWLWKPQEGAGKSHFLEAHSMVWRDRSWAVTGKAKTDEDRRTAITEENIKIVKDYFMEIEKHPQSLRPLGSLLFQSLDHPARPHKTEDVLTFLRLNFKGSVISRRSDQVAPLLARFRFPWLLLVVRHDQRPTMQAGDHRGIGGGCQIRRAHLSCPHDPHGSRKCSEKNASSQKGATLKPYSNSFRSSTLSLYLLMFINSFLWSFQISI